MRVFIFLLSILSQIYNMAVLPVMKFTIQKESFEKAMSQIDAIVPGRDTQTLLSNVLLTVTDDQKLRVTASDMESTVRITLDVENAVAGELIIKAKKLSDIAKQIKADTILFEAEQNEESAQDSEQLYRIKLEGQGSRAARFKMTGSDRSHFPEINEVQESKLSPIPADILADMITRTFYSISHEDNRYIYNGICFQIEGKNLALIGTDGRRLAAISRELPEPVSFGDSEGDIVVHAKAVRELQKIMEMDKMVYIAVEQRDIFFKVGNAELSSRLLEGKFPDYKKVIPPESPIQIEMERNLMLDSIRQVMVMTEQPSFQVKMSMGPEGSFLKANTPELGEAELTLPIGAISDEIEIGFNANYFMDILKSLQCEKIKIKMTDPAKPIVFEDIEDENFVALVMPMKI